MQKSVLFLINGLGIERANSYSVYSDEIMPTMSSMIKNGLFASLETEATDYEKGYQLFSLGTLSPNSFPFIENILDNKLLKENPKYNDLITKTQTSKTIHFIHHFIDEKGIEQLKRFIMDFNHDKDKNIYIHFIFTADDIIGYRAINKYIGRLGYEISGFAKVGMLFGEKLLHEESKLNDLHNVIRMLYKGTGEKWQELEKKLESLYDLKITPQDTKVFCVNDGFALSENDTFFIFNYEAVDCSALLEKIQNPSLVLNGLEGYKNIRYTSLMPIKATEVVNVECLYHNATSEFSIAKALETVNKQLLIAVDAESLNITNFMCNGMEKKTSPHINYVQIDNILYAEQLNTVLNNPQYDVIIINHRIDGADTIEAIKNKLLSIDKHLEMIKELCTGKATLLVSSLYGIKKEMKLENETVTIDFTGKVPFVVEDIRYDQKNYKLAYGTTYDLFMTALKEINPELKITTLIRKKDFVSSLLTKK